MTLNNCCLGVPGTGECPGGGEGEQEGGPDSGHPGGTYQCTAPLCWAPPHPLPHAPVLKHLNTDFLLGLNLNIKTKNFYLV